MLDWAIVAIVTVVMGTNYFREARLVKKLIRRRGSSISGAHRVAHDTESVRLPHRRHLRETGSRSLCPDADVPGDL